MRQREMREKIGQEKPAKTQEVLKQIKTAPAATDDEVIALYRLIGDLKGQLDPSAIFMLQIDVTVRHYNANKKPEDAEMTTADALLLGLSRRTSS